MSTIAHTLFKHEADCNIVDVDNTAYEELDELLDRTVHMLEEDQPPIPTLQTIATGIQQQGFSFTDTSMSLTTSFRDKTANCHTLAVLYYAVGEVADLPVYAVNVPTHQFVRWDEGEVQINWEPTEETFPSDDAIRRQFYLHPTPLNTGLYLASLDATALQSSHHALLGAWLYAEDQMAAAEDELTTAIHLCPAYPTPYFNRGNIYLKQGDLAAAWNDYQTAIECDPHFIAAYDQRAAVERSLGYSELALASTATALKLHPRYDRYLQHGFACYESQDYAGAIEDFTTAMEYDENPEIAYYGRGMAAAAQNDYTAALADFTAALGERQDEMERA